MRRIVALLLILAAVVQTAVAVSQKAGTDVPYLDNPSDEYAKQRCVLDIYAPKFDKTDKKLPVFVWFHGGGITSGSKKDFPQEFLAGDYILVSVNYRLSPKIHARKAVDDAAAAIAWTFKNIEKFGGDAKKIFIGGHSAGAYLSGMVGANPALLKPYGISNCDIAGMLLVSGQATSHFRVRKDSDDTRAQFAPRIDQDAILWYVENKMSPLCLILGDRNIEFPERVEENILLASALKKLGTSKNVKFYELQGYNHGEVVKASPLIIKNFILAK